MELSPEQTIYRVTKQVSTDTERLRLFPAYSQTTMLKIGTQSQGKIWKKLKHFETKNHPAQE